jgi:hypothetical protein
LRRSMNPASGVQSAFSRSVALRRVGLKFRMPKRTRHAFIRLTMRAFAYQIFAFARRTLGVFLLKKPGIASTPCTTRSAARTSWPMPMPSAAPTKAHRVWMVRTPRTSRRMGCSGGSANCACQSVPGDRQLHRSAVAPVVALQAQGPATQGRSLSTLAPLRALRARTTVPAWVRRAVGEGVKSCPRAGCGKSACPVR